MGILYFIRHGQASFGQKNYDRLSPAGIQQARILGEYLAGIRIAFHEAYCGEMVRQQHTAQEVITGFASAGLEFPSPLTQAAFDEYDAFTVWKNQTNKMIQEKVLLPEEIDQARTDKRKFQQLFERVMMRWISGDHDDPGNIRWKDFVDRVLEGITALTTCHGSGQHIAVFTSGGPISIAMQLALGLSDSKTMEISWQVMNASVSRFYFNSRGIFLAGFNDIAHLAIKQDSSLLTYR
ncbi:MAG: histidine phosphatase family protein [Deltaproteobacteria bacterium]|nr:histidine phosphatase family protein [Deltaproteobacteria bacterium]